LAILDGDEGLGQKPFTQEIILVAARLVDRCACGPIRRFISGFDRDAVAIFTPQSPQPSQTSSLMIIRACRDPGKVPRFLRRRRFSAAQVWS
jgi:hypothetical protein